MKKIKNLDTNVNQLNNTRKFQKESYSYQNNLESPKHNSEDLSQNHTDINHKYNDVYIGDEMSGKMSSDEENQEGINMPDSDSSVNLWMRANTYMVQGTHIYIEM
jgi:hypothetical protein